jgi:2-oxoglutarate ferredoxin oxidoreductase subunit alpha
MAEIPCVIVNVQRGGPSTGVPTHVSQGDVMQARWGTHGDHSIVALTASNHQDVFAMTVEAFNIAETYRTPVVLLFDEVVGHMRERLEIPEPGEIPLVERLRTAVQGGWTTIPYLPREDGRLPMSDFGGVHRYNVTGLVHDMWGFPSDNPKIVHGLLRHLVDKIENNAGQMARYKTFYLEDAETVLVSYGSRRRARPCTSLRSLRPRGEKIGLLELQTIWPFPADVIASTATGQVHGGGGDEHGPGVPDGQNHRAITRSGCFWPTASTACSSPIRISRNILNGLSMGRGV